MILNGSTPSFELAGGGLWLALTRGMFFAAMALSYGTALFRCRIAPPSLRLMAPADANALNARYRRLGIGSLIAAIVLIFVWLLVQTAAIAGSDGLIATCKFLPTIFSATTFGHTLILQAIALVAALAVLIFRKPVSETFVFVTVIVGCAIVAQAWHGHAAAMYEGFSPLLLSEIAHFLAASAWLGSLVPLLLLVRARDTKSSYLAVHRYASFGTACVLTLLITAGIQGYVLIGSIPGLVGTAYGWMALIKFTLFMILLVLAAFNRYRLTPHLRENADAARKLATSIVLETGFGLALLCAASVLIMLPPAMHTQAVWPFTGQFSLVTLREAPEFRPEVVAACLALLAALVLIVSAIFLRHLRYIAPVLAVAIVWFALPHLDLLFVEAYPTSFYHSPTAFSARSIAAGAKLYPENCARCHGANGEGDGPDAAGLAVPPADLTAGHLWGHSDGELFWWLTDGIDAPDGTKVMPPFAGVLSEEERWQLIDFIRARNAGINHMQVQAPRFSAQCASGATSLAALHGHIVRLVFGADTTPPQNIGDRVTTIVVKEGAQADLAHCTSKDQSVNLAYAILSGIAPDELQGRQFLIDANGWLRAWQRPEPGQGWNDPNTLLANVQEIADHPLAAMDMSHAHHHH